jgi:catechol 2,3-dioxygenase-like lactoylglutathione lyase family enzyme
MSATTPVVTGLFHVAIKTNDLEATNAFYKHVMGLRLAHRPDFGFPGSWIAVPTPVGEAIIHVYAGGPVMVADEGKKYDNTGAIDHLSISAIGFDAFRERFKHFGLPWREAIVPGINYWQLFVYDPSGVQLEITFHGDAEGRPAPDIPEAMKYIPGVRFFDAKAYDRLKARLAQPA